ncbi:MAG: AAA family ATPase [Proteobacteria bacterium]|nr:AAA family ATPase [Pseudomonadota bacterium]
MIRFASRKLDEWLKGPNRKPMVIRGARRVGKTWLVRDFADRNGLKLIELNPEKAVPQTLHARCMDLYQQYRLIGGMPEAVQIWLDSKDMQACIKIQHDLLATYRDDFP